MAHSIQVIGDRHLMLNDVDLFAVISLANLATAEAADGDRFTEIVSAWNAAVEAYGPGTINLNLPSAVEPAAREDLRELIEKLKRKAVSYGEMVPAQVLQRSKDVIFRDYPSRMIVETLDEIARFVG